MLFLKYIICVLLSLNHINTCMGFNMAFNRRTILKSGLLASSSVNLSNNIKLGEEEEEEEEESEGKIGKTKNSIYLTGELTEQTCWSLTESLLSYKNQLLNNDNRFNAINLYIQSPGGSLLPTLALVDEIRTLEIPVHTYVRGYAASAATLLSVIGTKRYMYTHSLMMIHSVKLHNQEPRSLLEVKDLNTNVDVFMDIIKNIYLENSNINSETLDELFNHDIWMNSSNALKYGLIDEII